MNHHHERSKCLGRVRVGGTMRLIIDNGIKSLSDAVRLPKAEFPK